MSCFPKASVTKYLKLGGLKQQNFMLMILQGRSSKARYLQGHAPNEICGEYFLASSSFSYVLAILDIPCLVDASLQSLLPSSHGLLPLCVCLHRVFPLLIETPGELD